mmetsp:Transcript_26296/g.68365  ORF Transcript_26296/g.68365 Transcript_26296/m.68365 type:complete len:203 (+) Transcript_26296:1614-2222(+)
MVGRRRPTRRRGHGYQLHGPGRRRVVHAHHDVDLLLLHGPQLQSRRHHVRHRDVPPATHGHPDDLQRADGGQEEVRLYPAHGAGARRLLPQEGPRREFQLDVDRRVRHVHDFLPPPVRAAARGHDRPADRAREARRRRPVQGRGGRRRERGTGHCRGVRRITCRGSRAYPARGATPRRSVPLSASPKSTDPLHMLPNGKVPP